MLGILLPTSQLMLFSLAHGGAMRNNYTFVPNIPISNLQLDLGNFRIGNAENQRECIALMLVEKRSKEQLIQLAKDIATRGLSPMPIIVTPLGNGNYVVKDGNRRVTALKLLNNPNEAPENFRATFANIAENSKIELYDNIDCYETTDDYALEFMELAHLGFQDGVGQIPWGSNEKDNLMEFKGEKIQNDVAREIISYLNSIGISGTDKVKVTIFQRLFQDKQVRDLIGIEWDGEKLIIIADDKDVTNILSEILLDFTERGYITRNIFTAEERVNYIEDLFARGVQKARPKGYNSPPVTPAISPPETPTTSPTGPITYPPMKPSWDRPRLIPPRSYLAIPRSETKVSNIANELARKINVKESPNAAAVLLRLLIEFSVDHYSQKYSLKPKNDKLAARIELSAKKLNSEGHITDKQLEQLEKMRQSNEILSAHTLNAWIHHQNYSPDPQILCIFWDNISFFVNHCWTK